MNSGYSISPFALIPSPFRSPEHGRRMADKGFSSPDHGRRTTVFRLKEFTE
jgi:hypothetical protein